ncbi:MAG: helix-turn-helix domain-containing protein [Thermoanaerobaculaceae bacterium]|jgi:excisionase family DNA binding protein|nr:helix-turn-helix domain-containing protein [Thermoanaerobaculaceae bacterium]
MSASPTAPPISDAICGSSEDRPIEGLLEAALRALLVKVIRQELPAILREELQRHAYPEARPAATAPVNEYLTADEAGKVAGVRAATVRRWVYRGELPGHYSGRLLRVRRDELKAYLARDRGTSEPVDMDRRVTQLLSKLD